MTVEYRPTSLYQRVLARLQSWENSVGRSARRKLKRAYALRVLAAFDARLAEIGPGDIALDFGANVGRFTRKLAATGAEVHAFEPDPDTFVRLQAAVGALKNVHLHQVAVGAMAGTVALHRARQDRHAQLSEMSSVVFAHSRHCGAATVTVEQRAFKDVVNGFDRPVALIKMDIEGSEFDLLREVFADPLTYRFEALFVETHESAAVHWVPAIDSMRRRAAVLTGQRIDLFWP